MKIKIEIDLPDKNYEKLKSIYEQLDQDLDKSLEKIATNFINDSLKQLEGLI